MKGGILLSHILCLNDKCINNDQGHCVLTLLERGSYTECIVYIPVSGGLAQS